MYSQEGLQVLLSLVCFKLSWPLCGPCHVLPYPAVGLILSLLSFLCSCLDFFPSGSLFFLFTSCGFIVL